MTTPQDRERTRQAAAREALALPQGHRRAHYLTRTKGHPMTISPDTRVEPALERYIYLTGAKLGEVEDVDLPGYRAELAELLALHAALPPQDTPELSRAARALYVADHAHNPYAPGDWDNRSVPYAERRRYIGLARTTISTYQQEATK